MIRNIRNRQIGQLSDESFAYKEITWKISKDGIAPNISNYEVHSPPFSFACATWSLLLSPYGHSRLESDGWIDLGIERLNSNVPEHHVSCKFFFKTHRGKEFEPYQETFIFDANCKVEWMMYTEKTDFLRKEKVVTKDDVLTIVCQLRTPMVHGIEAFSQVEIVESITESSASRSKEQTSSASICKDSDRLPEPSSPENKVLQDFKKLFIDQEDCDVTITVNEQVFKAHRNILKARSPVLASFFKYDMKEKNTGVININDCDKSTFSDFLCFIYCGNTEIVTIENVFELFIVADKYDVQDLRSKCLEFLKENLSVDTFCDTATLAFQHFEKELVELTSDFFAKNLEEIIVTVEWQSFVSKYPTQSNEIMIKGLVKKSNKV